MSTGMMLAQAGGIAAVLLGAIGLLALFIFDALRRLTQF